MSEPPAKAANNHQAKKKNVKKEKKASVEHASKFEGDGLLFKAKLYGTADVAEARGDAMCHNALQLLKMEIRSNSQHKQKIVIKINMEGVTLLDAVTNQKLLLHQVSEISFITKDTHDNRSFCYVVGNHERKYTLFGLKTEKAAEVVMLAMRDLFQAVSLQMKQSHTNQKRASGGSDNSAADNNHRESITSSNTSLTYKGEVMNIPPGTPASPILSTSTSEHSSTNVSNKSINNDNPQTHVLTQLSQPADRNPTLATAESFTDDGFANFPSDSASDKQNVTQVDVGELGGHSNGGQAGGAINNELEDNSTKVLNTSELAADSAMQSKEMSLEDFAAQIKSGTGWGTSVFSTSSLAEPEPSATAQPPEAAEIPKQEVVWENKVSAVVDSSAVSSTPPGVNPSDKAVDPFTDTFGGDSDVKAIDSVSDPWGTAGSAVADSAAWEGSDPWANSPFPDSKDDSFFSGAAFKETSFNKSPFEETSFKEPSFATSPFPTETGNQSTNDTPTFDADFTVNDTTNVNINPVQEYNTKQTLPIKNLSLESSRAGANNSEICASTEKTPKSNAAESHALPTNTESSIIPNPSVDPFSGVDPFLLNDPFFTGDSVNDDPFKMEMGDPFSDVDPFGAGINSATSITSDPFSESSDFSTNFPVETKQSADLFSSSASSSTPTQPTNTNSDTTTTTSTSDLASADWPTDLFKTSSTLPDKMTTPNFDNLSAPLYDVKGKTTSSDFDKEFDKIAATSSTGFDVSAIEPVSCLGVADKQEMSSELTDSSDSLLGLEPPQCPPPVLPPQVLVETPAEQSTQTAQKKAPPPAIPARRPPIAASTQPKPALPPVPSRNIVKNIPTTSSHEVLDQAVVEFAPPCAPPPSLPNALRTAPTLPVRSPSIDPPKIPERKIPKASVGEELPVTGGNSVRPLSLPPSVTSTDC